MQPWIVNPAGLISYGDSRHLRAPEVDLDEREEAVISSNIIPYGLMRKWRSAPGTRAEMCVNTRSSDVSQQSHQAVGGGEVDTHVPFRRTHLLPNRRNAHARRLHYNPRTPPGSAGREVAVQELGRLSLKRAK